MRLDTKEEIGLFRYNEPIQRKSIRKFQEYARALIGAVMNAQENQHLHGDDWQRTVYIDTLDVGTTDFDLSDKQKEALVRQGIKGAETCFQWFENPRERPVNRIDAEEVCRRTKGGSTPPFRLFSDPGQLKRSRLAQPTPKP